MRNWARTGIGKHADNTLGADGHHGQSQVVIARQDGQVAKRGNFRGLLHRNSVRILV